MNFTTAQHRYDNATPLERTPYSAQPEIMGITNTPKADADEWMVATGIYDVETGVLQINGNCWMGMLNVNLGPEMVDAVCGFDAAEEEHVDEAKVDSMLGAFHESFL